MMFLRQSKQVHICHNLLEEGGLYINTLTNRIDPTITAADFLSPMIHHSREQYTNATGIPASKEFLTCQPTKTAALQSLQPQYQWREDSINVISCYGPAGAITDHHTDSALLGTIVTVWVGKKTWITWPPTGSNLSLFATKHF